ncbi:type 4 pilus major pilin [Xanthomonas euvesicatoria pv. eucalypti]|uniref:type 4 pilus major pilin n=1 Tax=Xanthomonas euvesicatoria TaxID=456327 RepID=UPI00080DFC25|nr:type 4 pilus major pilin [Xanthomonas euvesicatoria]MDO7931593.1 type 4 pilus major pilin [Xanthomonas euvesicatoria pv. eucalypti]MDO7935680.1 type 4 pilus major pilin [Xanthomonas euvesicatoria pv. eucalypti]MDO7940121.1 type 4 pilus major pilin [Xanthomonas euvesicatoria pv. eucalypti]MDO7944526.1 type 4 pilus major pilin [Xanthomonas euvesicatoria pv. eucalypti]MDO7952042.1 type 4 pilus major pilin [Xanthomonas euvesicatoria pv. eucalypti]
MKRIRSFASPRSQAGVSLVELVIGMVILGAIVIAILGVARGARGSSKVQTEGQNYNALIECTRNMKSAGTYGASGTNLMPAAINRQCVPTTMPVTGTTAANQFGGAVTLVSTGTGFTLTTAAIPQEVCSGLATDLSQSGAYSTKINSGTAITGPVSVASADAGCNATANTVAWTITN